MELQKDIYIYIYKHFFKEVWGSTSDQTKETYFFWGTLGLMNTIFQDYINKSFVVGLHFKQDFWIFRESFANFKLEY